MYKKTRLKINNGNFKALIKTKSDADVKAPALVLAEDDLQNAHRFFPKNKDKTR